MPRRIKRKPRRPGAKRDHFTLNCRNIRIVGVPLACDDPTADAWTDSIMLRRRRPHR